MRIPHIIAINQKYLSNESQDLSKCLYFRLFMLQSDCFYFHDTRTVDHFLFLQKNLGGQFLFIYLQSSLWVTSWPTPQYLATLARKNLCVPARAHNQSASLAGWDGCWKRRFCLAGESVNMQLFLKDSLSSRLLLSLRCVFDNKLTPFISGFSK